MQEPDSESVKEDGTTVQAEDSQEQYYPDGGKRATLVCIGCFLCATGTLGVTNGNGTIENYISSNILINESTSNISWIFAGFNVASFGPILILGPLFDQIGAKIMLLCSAGCFAVGFMCFAAAHQLYQFVLCYCVCGLGVSFSYVCTITAVTHWYNKRRSLAVGATLVGSGFGGIIIPIILQQLFKSVGFAWAIRILGFIGIFLIMSAFLLVRDRRQELGLLEGKENDPSTSKIKRAITPIISAAKQVNFKTLNERVFFTLTLACMGNSGPFFLTLNYLVSYATANGWSADTAYYLLVTLNSMSIVGRIIGGYWSDRYGRFNFFLVSNILACVAVFVCWLPPVIGHSKPGLFIFTVLFGFTSGSYYQSSPTCVAQISSIKDFTTKYGTFCFIIALFNFILLPLGGLIVGNSTNSTGYDHLIILIAVIQFFGTVNIIICRVLYGGFKWVKL